MARPGNRFCRIPRAVLPGWKPDRLGGRNQTGGLPQAVTFQSLPPPRSKEGPGPTLQTGKLRLQGISWADMVMITIGRLLRQAPHVNHRSISTASEDKVLCEPCLHRGEKRTLGGSHCVRAQMARGKAGTGKDTRSV